VGNYTITDQASTSANITPKAITISGITAANKTYDGTISATVSSTNASGWLSGDKVTVAATGTFDNKNAATGKTVTLTSSYGGDDAGNYTFTDQLTTMASINAKVVNLLASKTYDGTNSLTNGVQIAGLVGTEKLSYKDATVNDVHVATAGKYINQIVLTDGASGDLASNYALPVLNATNAPVSISQTKLSVTANDASKTQDGTAFTGGNGVRYAGFVNGESANVLSGSLDWGGTSQGATTAGTYVITPKGLASGDYAINFVDGQLVITAQQMVVVPPLPTNPAFVLPSRIPTGSGDNPNAGANSSTSSGTSAPIVPSSLPAETSNPGDSNSASSAGGKSTAVTASINSTTGGASASANGFASGNAGTTANPVGAVSGASSVVTMSLVRAASANEPGLAMAYVPRKLIASQEGFSFSLPKEALVGAASDAFVSLSKANGQPLPSWLRYDVTLRRFLATGVPPQGLPLQLQLNVGGQVSIIYISDVDS